MSQTDNLFSFVSQSLCSNSILKKAPQKNRTKTQTNRLCSLKGLVAKFLGSILGPVGQDVLNPVLPYLKLVQEGPAVPAEELIYHD